MHAPEEREIFRYHNGTREVCADPMALYRRFLKAVGGEKQLTTLEEQIRGENEELAGQATEQLLAAIQAGFNLKPLDEDGNGATESEQFKAYFDFLEYLADSKKKVENSPTWQPPMGEASLAAAGSTTPTGSPSGSTAPAPSSSRRR